MKCLLTSALLAALAVAAAPAPDDAATIAAQKPSYPLTTCVMSGEPLDGGEMEGFDLVYEGRLVRFCCKPCSKDFLKAPAETLKKLDDAIVAAQKADYPLTTCPVTGEELDDARQYAVAGTKLVETCCRKCAKDVAAHPDKYLPAVDAAYIEKQSKGYPLATCAQDDKPLGDKAVKLLHGTTLVQLCSDDCAAAFRKDAKPALAKLAAARQGTAEPPKEGAGR